MIQDRQKYSDLSGFISEVGKKETELIQVLHRAQGLFGYLPADVQLFISDETGIPINRIQGVISFYNFFSTSPKGRFNVVVCMGTACYVRGADSVMEELEQNLGIRQGETTADGLFSLESARCFGACALAPAIMVNGQVYGNVNRERIAEILGEYREKAASIG